MTPIKESEFLTSLGLQPAADHMRECIVKLFESIGWDDAASAVDASWPEYSEEEIWL